MDPCEGVNEKESGIKCYLDAAHAVEGTIQGTTSAVEACNGDVKCARNVILNRDREIGGTGPKIYQRHPEYFKDGDGGAGKP